MYLSISDSLWAITLLWDLNVPLSDGDTLCNFAGFMLQWFVVCSDYLVAFLAISMCAHLHSFYLYSRFLTIVFQLEMDKWWWDLICVGTCFLPTFILALIPLFGGTPGGYGPRGAWCWIEVNDFLCFIFLLFRTLLRYLFLFLFSNIPGVIYELYVCLDCGRYYNDCLHVNLLNFHFYNS